MSRWRLRSDWESASRSQASFHSDRNGVRFRTTGNNTEDCELAVTNVRLPDVPLATPVRLGVSVKVAGVVPVNADILSHENGLVTVKLIGLPSLLFTDKVWAAGACRP